MSEKYPHLNEATASLASGSAKERIYAIQAGVWVTYSRAKEILARMEMLFEHPPIDRMPNMLIVGESNNGKTQILNHFVATHPPDPNPEGDAAIVPVVMVRSPSTPDVGRLCAHILDAVNAPYRESANESERVKAAKTVLGRIGTRMLIIDEIQDMLAGSVRKQREFRNEIKGLGNFLKIPIVAAGVEDAYAVFATDPQLSNRFYPEPLPSWTMDNELGRLLASIEQQLPLRRASNLKSPELLQKLFFLGEKTIGGIYDVIKEAARVAIENGSERISVDLLNGLRWKKPSDRKKRPALA